MRLKTLVVTGTVLVSSAFLVASSAGVLAQGLQNPMRSLRAHLLRDQAPKVLEINDHHFGVGIRVDNPGTNADQARVIRYVDLGDVEHLADDRAPFRAEAIVNGISFSFERNADGELEVEIPARHFGFLFADTVTVTGYDRHDIELATFEMGGLRFF